MGQHVGTNFSIEQQLEQLSAIQSAPDFSITYVTTTKENYFSNTKYKMGKWKNFLGPSFCVYIMSN